MEVIKMLLVEDDEAFRTITKCCLELTGEYQVYEAKDGYEGFESFQSQKFDVIVTDIDMPKISGLTMIDLIRKEDKDVPILITSGLTDSKNVHEGFEREIDNYIKKPFQPEELDDFVKSVLRQRKKTFQIETEEIKKFQLGAYIFDLENRCLIYKETILLSGREAQILYLLYTNKNKIVNRADILKKIWDEAGDSFFQSRILDVNISKLRKYLNDDPTIKIVNFRGKGLKLTF